MSQDWLSEVLDEYRHQVMQAVKMMVKKELLASHAAAQEEVAKSQAHKLISAQVIREQIGRLKKVKREIKKQIKASKNNLKYQEENTGNKTLIAEWTGKYGERTLF